MKRIAFLLIASLAIVLSNSSGSETLTSETLLPLHNSKDAYTPAMAYGKKGCLVVWQSGRTGEGSMVKSLLYGADLVACRVDMNGKPLDKEPIVLSSATDLQEKPHLAFGDNLFLAVWQDLRNGKDYDIYAARVTLEGKVLDKEGILVSGLRHNQCIPKVAWDGKAFQVVWQDFRSNVSYEIYGARVSTTGKVLDPEGLLLKKRFKSSTDGGSRYSPAIASRGEGESLVLWCSHWRGGHSGGVMVKEGQVVDENANTFAGRKKKKDGPTTQSHPISLAAGPDGFFASWMSFVPSGRGGGTRDSNAMVLGKSGKHMKYLFLAGKQHYIRQSDVIWDGSAYSAGWIERIVVKRGQAPHDAVFLTRISQQGEPVGPVHAMAGTFESPASKPTVATDGKGTTFIAYERHPKTGDVPIKIAFRMLRAK